jgi:CRISPR/Cas system-associated endonuclease Cas1
VPQPPPKVVPRRVEFLHLRHPRNRATIAAHKLGFDPSLGLMHVDQRYRSSLATDLMEPARPTADGLVLDLVEGHALRRGDVVETREGVVRIGAPMARLLAGNGQQLRAAVAPHAEQLARTLLRAQEHPTPLTRTRHRLATSKHRTQEAAQGVRAE